MCAWENVVVMRTGVYSRAQCEQRVNRRHLSARHFNVDLDRQRQLLLLETVNLHHVALPVVFSGKRPAALSRVVAAVDGAVELLLLLVPVVNVALQMRLCSEALAAAWVGTLVVFAVVTLMVPVEAYG